MGWAAIVRRDAAPQQQQQQQLQDWHPKSAQGITTMVVDANAFISGINLSGMQYELCTLREVANEIRDPRSRAYVDALPVEMKFLEPSPESVSRVTDFARLTGDLHALSSTDIKVIALVHTLEVEAYGADHLRTEPPPLVRSAASKRLPDPPGWGSNVPNAEEWDELPDSDKDDDPGAESRILGLKDLRLDAGEARTDRKDAPEEAGIQAQVEDKPSSLKTFTKVKPERKRLIAEGIDASKGQVDQNNDDWEEVRSKSTRRKHTKAAVQGPVKGAATIGSPKKNDAATTSSVSEKSDAATASSVSEKNDAAVTSSVPEKNDENSPAPEDEEQQGDSECEEADEALDDECGEVQSEADDSSSREQSSMSTVACMTTDFAMQNVILQMGLRLFTPTGLQVRRLHRWMLKCHACGKVTNEVDRVFCPKCGNGGTLFRVSTMVGENGTVQAGSLRRISVRGTRFSLPLPKGGRDGSASNIILREDQLPRKGKQKKATSNLGIQSFDDVFVNKNKPGRESVALKKTIAMLSGRKNPNDSHYTKHRA